MDYTYSDFDFNTALNGYPVVVMNYADEVFKSFPDDGNIQHIFIGKFEKINTQTYIIKLNGVACRFDMYGRCIDDTSFCGCFGSDTSVGLHSLKGYHLSLVDGTASLYKGSSSGITDTVSGETVNVDISSLEPRDEFAMAALKLLIGSNDMNDCNTGKMIYLCRKSYEWANCMLTAAAEVRALDTSVSSDTDAVKVGTLNSNTEKLMNNIYIMLKNLNNTMKSSLIKDDNTPYMSNLEGLSSNLTSIKTNTANAASSLSGTLDVDVNNTVDTNVTNKVTSTVEGTVDVNVTNTVTTTSSSTPSAS